MVNGDPNKVFDQICIVSRQGVCLLDMEQVADAAERMGLHHLARLVREDLEKQQIDNGNYFRLIAPLFGAK